MAYKRNVDRLPIVPADAKEHNVVCHYCIVGCGYKAYSWDVNRQGGTAPDQNKFGVDLARQQEPETPAWYSPSMYNIVRQGRARRAPRRQARQGMRRQRRPGLDPRGADRRDVLLGRPGTQQQRLTTPVVWRYGQMQPTSWRTRSTSWPGHRAVIKEQGEDGLFVSASDHGGAERLRVHLGHRQALLRRHEGEEHPHPQPARLQLRGPRHPRHGRGRAQQLLRGRRLADTDLRRRHQRLGDPDQLLPRPLGPEPARQLLAREEAPGDAGRAARQRADRDRRPAPDRDRGGLRGRGRHGRVLHLQLNSAPTWCSSTRS